MKFASTLRSRLALLVLLAVVPLLGLSLTGVVLTARDNIAKATKNLELSASLVAASQQRIADSVSQVLSAMAYVPDLVDGKEPFCQQYFRTLATERQALIFVARACEPPLAIGPAWRARVEPPAAGDSSSFSQKPLGQKYAR